jgi:8-oxo-dGTP pyrophosphatase MutT (NUDIX family)
MNNIFFDRCGRKKIKPNNQKILKRISAYGIAIKDGKILLVRPSWKKELDLPGGGIEHGETLTRGLIREFHEETGFLVTPAKKPFAVKTQAFYAEDLDKYFDSKQYFFRVTIIEHDNSWKMDKKEIRKVIWVDIKKLNDINLKDTYLDIIKDCLRK